MGYCRPFPHQNAIPPLFAAEQAREQVWATRGLILRAEPTEPSITVAKKRQAVPTCLTERERETETEREGDDIPRSRPVVDQDWWSLLYSAYRQQYQGYSGDETVDFL